MTSTQNPRFITDAELQTLDTAAVFMYLDQAINIKSVETTARKVVVSGYFNDGGPARITLKRTR